jgi:hypothetical protein
MARVSEKLVIVADDCLVSNRICNQVVRNDN